jgi:Arc/MetJ-type ribon-helix-helix transcriptional regulator
MQIQPTPDQEAFIRQAIDAGRLSAAEDAAREAMALWEDRERRRIEILMAIDEAEASIAVRVDSLPQDTVDDLASRIKRRGRERLERERHQG